MSLAWLMDDVLRVLMGLLLILVAGLPLLAPVDELRRLPVRLCGVAGSRPATRTPANQPPSDRRHACFGVASRHHWGLSPLPHRSAGPCCLSRPGPLSLFVPLPLVTTACQMAFGGLLPSVPGSAWSIGLAPAILINSLLGLPWCIVVIGLGLSWVEPELEEDALTQMSAWQVLCRVTVAARLPFHPAGRADQSPCRRGTKSPSRTSFRCGLLRRRFTASSRATARRKPRGPSPWPCRSSWRACLSPGPSSPTGDDACRHVPYSCSHPASSRSAGYAGRFSVRC